VCDCDAVKWFGTSIAHRAHDTPATMAWPERLQTLVRGEVWKGEDQGEVKVNESVLQQLVSQGFPLEAARVSPPAPVKCMCESILAPCVSMQKWHLALEVRASMCTPGGDSSLAPMPDEL